MPEGDTIHKTAARLRPALEGRELVRFEAPRILGSRPRPGTVITKVEAVGKHLLIHFADGRVLQTHMRMTGRWDLYRTGERWKKPRHLARAIVEVPGYVAVCFSAPVVRMLTAPQIKAGRAAMVPDRGPDEDPNAEPADKVEHSERSGVVAALGHLGPDLCLADVDLDAAVDRMAHIPEPDTAIADVLLDQRVAAGIGNVFKSEVLWACRLHPLTPVEQVDVALRRRLLETASRQLQLSLASHRRTTVTGPRGSLAVYGRGRRPCRRCGTPIAWRKTGPMHRSTYWCPRCQPERTDPTVDEPARSSPRR